MHYLITFQPNRYNTSDKMLIINFKKGLQRYYRKLFGARYNKYKDKQYKMQIDISHGDNDLQCTHPHLHIIANIPDTQITDFMAFMNQWLKRFYPKLSPDFRKLETSLDILRAGVYCLNQSVKAYTEQDIQDGNYII